MLGIPARMSRKRRIKIGGSLLPRLNLLAQIFRLGDRGSSILAALLEFVDVLRGLVPPRLHGLGFGDGLPALRIDVAEIPEHGGRIGAALAQHLLHPGQILANKAQIKHGNNYFIGNRCRECTRAREGRCGDSRSQLSVERSSTAQLSLTSTV